MVGSLLGEKEHQVILAHHLLWGDGSDGNRKFLGANDVGTVLVERVYMLLIAVDQIDGTAGAGQIGA